MKYLVTGGNGFLGKHLCRLLDDRKIDYISSVRIKRNPHDFETGDLCQFHDWYLLLNGVDVIVHTAAKAHDMSNSAELKNLYTTVNFELTKQLAEAAKANGVKKFIFISTIKVNGEFTDTAPFQADDIPQPTDDYGKSKKSAEDFLLKMHSPGFFDVVIIRPCLVYGKGVKANFNNLIGLVSKKLLLPFGAVHNKRSFVSVNNLSDLILYCATSAKASGQIFLASDDNDLSLTELIKTIASGLNIKTYLIPVPVGLMKFFFKMIGKKEFSLRLFSNLQVDIAKTKNLLGWVPPYKTENEIAKMLL